MAQKPIARMPQTMPVGSPDGVAIEVVVVVVVVVVGLAAPKPYEVYYGRFSYDKHSVYVVACDRTWSQVVARGRVGTQYGRDIANVAPYTPCHHFLFAVH